MRGHPASLAHTHTLRSHRRFTQNFAGSYFTLANHNDCLILPTSRYTRSSVSAAVGGDTTNGAGPPPLSRRAIDSFLPLLADPGRPWCSAPVDLESPGTTPASDRRAISARIALSHLISSSSLGAHNMSVRFVVTILKVVERAASAVVGG